MEPRDPLPDSLAAALADGGAIDWSSVEAASAAAGNATLVQQLKVIAAIRGQHAAAEVVSRPWLRQLVAATFVVGVALAAVKVLLALAGVPAALGRMSPSSPALPFAIILSVFGMGGLLMVGGGGRDRRLQILGGLYLIIAAAFVEPFRMPPTGPVGVVVTALSSCRPEAFFALGVWLFAWAFPSEPRSVRARAIAGTCVWAAVGLGAVLLVANVLSSVWPAHGSLAAALRIASRKSLTSWFWPSQILLALPAALFLPAKSRFESPEVRHKVRWFLGALGVGILPILVATIATPFVDALREPALRQRIGVGLYLALGSIVPITAYAVAVNRVMDLQFVIRATLQYALARYAIWAAILAPLTYLALDVFVNRGLTFLQYVDAREPAGLLAFSGVGLVTLTFRPLLVQAVDRWFLREPLDSPQALARLEHRLRASASLRDLSQALGDELARAVHADRVSVLVQAEDSQSFVALDGSVPPLPRQSVLLDLLQSTRSDVRFDARSAIVPLLPESDQEWLHDRGVHVLSPLLGSSGALLGVVAVGEAANRLPYTDKHLALVTAMGGQAAMQLENRSLREVQSGPGRGPVSVAGVGWRDEPASWCPTCTAVASPETRRCRCGGLTRAAVLPLYVNGKFRLQRFLGSGGTGVVYLATDLALERQVAIKSLPPMRREYAERLRREARAMAMVRHPNLATIYGAEEWQETPLLIVEYLEGGTLLDVLARGPMDLGEALDLGVMLADALDRVHGSGVLHRDIKPSNIGYTADGVPKLLDFGLAAMLDRSKGPDQQAAVMPVDPAEFAARFAAADASATLTVTQQVVGTPLYLSPEALAGSAPQASFDLWSLHMVLFEAIAGRHPYGGRSVEDVVHAVQHTALPDVRDLRPQCPSALAAYLNDALSRIASRRPATAGDIRTALRALRGRPVLVA